MKYKIPFVNLPKQYQDLQEEIVAVINDVLFKRADFILRDDLRKFEENIASFLGIEYAVGLNSGTDALFLSLKAAGIGPGDEVITVAHTFVATVAAIQHCGATPILIDIGEDYNMDTEKLEEAISSKTKAILPVHLNGRLCNMEKIIKIAQKYDLKIIEDAAQALGAEFDGKKAGTFGLAGCFSLYPMKILGGIGDGGIVVTNDQEFAEKIRFLRDHGQNRETGEIVFYGFNSRLDNVNAAILNLKLKYLPHWIERRREIATLYQEGLSKTPLKLPPPPSQGRYFDVFQNYVVRAENPERRDKIVKYLEEHGIEILIHWRTPLHKQKKLNLKFNLPMTERISKEVFSLPINTEITNKQVEYVIDCIINFYN